MRRELCIPAMVAVATLAWAAWGPGLAAAQDSSPSFAAGASLWDGVGVGLAYHETHGAARTPHPAGDMFSGNGVGDRYYADSYTGYDYRGYDDYGPTCRGYRDEYVGGWYDYGHRCRRRASRWGLAISFGFGWHYPAYYQPYFTWHDPFWSPWYSFDPWFGRGLFAFRWSRPSFDYGYSHPAYYSYPAYYGYSHRYDRSRSRYPSGSRIVYGSGYGRAYSPVGAIRYKETPRRTAVARTARAAPRTAVTHVTDRSSSAGPAARRSGVSARPRVVRPEPGSAATPRSRRTAESLSPGTRATSPRVQARPSTPRIQPRASAPPTARSGFRAADCPVAAFSRTPRPGAAQRSAGPAQDFRAANRPVAAFSRTPGPGAAQHSTGPAQGFRAANRPVAALSRTPRPGAAQRSASPAQGFRAADCPVAALSRTPRPGAAQHSAGPAQGFRAANRPVAAFLGSTGNRAPGAAQPACPPRQP